MGFEQHQLPPGWAIAELKDLGLVRSAICSPFQYPEVTFELWSVPAFESGEPEYLVGREIGSSKQCVEPDDILLCKINPRINRVWCVAKNCGFKQIASTEWVVFRSKHLDSDFLCYRLMDESVRTALCSNVSGVGGSLTRTRRAALEEIQITIPPRAEQVRIAERIKRLFAHSEKTRRNLDAIPLLLEKLRQSILGAAFRGDLTDDWRSKNPDVEPADILLERIRKERRKKWEEAELEKMKARGAVPTDDKWKAKYQEPKPANGADLPPLPHGWAWARMEQLITGVTSGSRGWARYYSNSGAIFIRAQDIKTDSLELDNVALVKPPRNAEGARTRVMNKDLLITITGANVTKSALADKDLPEAYVSQHVALARPVHQTMAQFLYYFLITPTQGRSQLETVAYGLGKPGLNLDNIRDLVVPLPPEGEQELMVRAITSQLAAVDKVRIFHKAAWERIEDLDSAILETAFSGRLVAQDPDDEPAKVLLDRIRQDREKEKAESKSSNLRKSMTRFASSSKSRGG